MHRRILLAFFAVIAIAQIARADSPSVTAVLSNSEATVGETVDLQIKVTGPGDARPPEEISIDGLEIHSTGTSRQFEIHNFSTSSSVTYNYTDPAAQSRAVHDSATNSSRRREDPQDAGTRVKRR